MNPNEATYLGREGPEYTKQRIPCRIPSRSRQICTLREACPPYEWELHREAQRRKNHVISTERVSSSATRAQAAAQQSSTAMSRNSRSFLIPFHLCLPAFYNTNLFEAQFHANRGKKRSRNTLDTESEHINRASSSAIIRAPVTPNTMVTRNLQGAA